MIKTKLNRNIEIKQQYLEKIKSGKDSFFAMDELSSEHDIGKLYIRTILKDQGVELERKTKYERSDKDELKKRDEDIINLFKKTDFETIALKYKLTPTRVRQILRRRLGKAYNKNPHEGLQLTLKLHAIQDELEAGIPYKTVVKKYGKEIIKQIQATLKVKIFKKSLEIKINNVISMVKQGIPPKEIAKKYNMTLNYTYMILHDNGIRFQISKQDKENRDKSIVLAKKNGTSVDEIATNHGITSTMVRIIISNSKNKSK